MGITLAATAATAARAGLVPLPSATAAGWTAYVRATEQRIDAELREARVFLAIDRAPSAAADRHALGTGAVVVREVETVGEGGAPIPVPDARVHHWRGAVFIPGVSLDRVMDVLETEPPDTRQEDVVDSRVMRLAPGAMTVFVKLRRTKVITVFYNTEHDVTFRRYGTARASSRSTATKIAELDEAGTPREREKTADEDRGFLWRLNAYWRYEAWQGGVIAECESISLSRSVPLLLRPLIGPMIDGTARESMERTLVALRLRFTSARPAAPSATPRSLSPVR